MAVDTNNNGKNMIQHPRRESSEFKDQFNIAGISADSADISWSVRVSYMIGSVIVKGNGYRLQC